jgi:pyruvate,water dikinase
VKHLWILSLSLAGCADTYTVIDMTGEGGGGEETSDDGAAGDDTGPAADTGDDWECVIPEGSDPDYSNQLGCLEDFQALASDPLDASIPGATSVKTVVDRSDSNALYFQNSERYPIHWDFASVHLSGGGLPYVQDLSSFNETEYYSPDRRFILGAVTWYEEPDAWVYEIAPYDTATADLIETAFDLIRDNSYFGGRLYFHPTSEAVEAEAADLPDDIPILTTDELFEGISYQPLNLGTSMGLLTFHEADRVEEEIPNYREIVVMDGVPNDISVVMGIITSEFQTPLSHINVLSQNRGTPNMALKEAWDNEALRALEGGWVELTVDAFDYSIREVTQAEADAWWEEHKPEPLEVTPMDLTVTDLRDEEGILDLETYALDEAVEVAVPAFGGKASHYGGFAHMEGVPHPRAFVIPVYYYNQFMEENGLWPEVEAMMADKEFQGDSSVRSQRLEDLRAAIEAGEVNADFLQALTDKLNAEYPGTRCRFRSSTNAEDLSGFNGAGLYTSKSGDPSDPDYPVDEAIKEVWASIWSFRAYEERQYYSIDHTQVGMALLVHRSFPDEEANGVAITANIYDTTGIEPGFYVNVQEGESSVVFPEDGVTTDQFIYYFDLPGQPVVYLEHSNLVNEGETVLTNSEIYALGTALKTIHEFWYPVYGGGSFYGMDTEFKFDASETGTAELYLKQARPYPGWSAD